MLSTDNEGMDRMYYFGALMLIALERTNLGLWPRVYTISQGNPNSIIGAAGYSLTRKSDGVVVASGSETNFTGYSATGSTVETLAGERDAYKRLMRILADQISARLLASADLAPTAAE